MLSTWTPWEERQVSEFLIQALILIRPRKTAAQLSREEERSKSATST